MARFNLDAYETVQDRITRFWQEYPNGSIITSVVSNTPDLNSVAIMATVRKELTDEQPSATGIAHEFRLAPERGMTNETSWWENCETSAIGRALANMGYATMADQRPSREEMEKVERVSSAPQFGDTIPDARPMQQRTPHPVDVAGQARATGQPQASPNKSMSDAQYNFIQRLANEKAYDLSQINFENMSSFDASQLIGVLKAMPKPLDDDPAFDEVPF